MRKIKMNYEVRIMNYELDMEIHAQFIIHNS